MDFGVMHFALSIIDHIWLGESVHTYRTTIGSSKDGTAYSLGWMETTNLVIAKPFPNAFSLVLQFYPKNVFNIIKFSSMIWVKSFFIRKFRVL